VLDTLTKNPPAPTVSVEKRSVGSDVEVVVRLTGAGNVILHWGVAARKPGQWQAPPESAWPAGTKLFNKQAVQTPFPAGAGERTLTLRFNEAEAPRFLVYVLFHADTNRWDNNGGKDFWVQLVERSASALPLSAMQERIVDGEMGPHGWTLMHRFNLCHELIDEARDAREAWATLFVWLRYSAIRQLDWQRNYNTKPRELSHAQDRLTARLATAFIQQPANRDLIRAMLAGLGRGGDGQRIRDEILQIMHRHHIKEVGGTWMEQWHQKLHNNTTPDDVVICEAYLAFLHANGDRSRYHETLLAGGVTKERLASFERPINTEPEWHPHLKEGLLHDFGNYLVVLKSVHSGTDLFTAINAGGHLLDSGARDTLGRLLHNFQNPHVSVTDLVSGITNVRKSLHARLNHEGNAGLVKELLYLDLALEQALRTVIERAIHSGFSGEQLLELIARAGGENLQLVVRCEELNQCQREWQRLPAEQRFSPDWALHAKAALDRLRRAVEGQIDSAYQLLQPKAEALGKAFNADEWVVKLFSEEVVRGQSVFLLSMLIHHFDPVLRKQAKLGDWQVISPSSAVGEVLFVESFRTVQGQRFERPTIIVAEKVFGDEEPPEGVRAVITPSSVDLVSHVAVRARNANLLFATCYDRTTFDKLKATQGSTIELKVSATGDVLFGEAKAKIGKTAARAAPPSTAKVAAAKPSLDVLTMAEFAKGRVGGKSWHLKELSAKLPDWLHTPRSVALPFGVFDAVLAEKANAAMAKRYRSLVDGLSDKPEAKLAEIRASLLELEIPAALQTKIQAAMKQAGLPAAKDWSVAAQRIKQVWASKWNDRAFFSRQARSFPHDAVQMAVLIQEVVEAEFAFVIHTVNPFNGNRNEVYAEVVLGLGETLVGNYPGRALSFVCPKKGGAPTVLAYPSKSVGLFGGGLIFRSDSNAEDLEGYAGAGLYDSVLAEEPRELTLDYTHQTLVWDGAKRADLLSKVARIGEAVEDAFGAPQDIEGAFVNGKFFVVQTRPQVGLT
jgi:alpha-glucan,water dikinase